MGLLSIFQRNKQTSAKPGGAAKPGRGGRSAARQAPLANTPNPAETADAVREARARARRRLMGATVLLLVGVIGFPLLFETQPRPIPVDLPIEIPARNAPGVGDGSASPPHGNRSVASLITGAPPAAPVASGPVPESVSYDARSAAAPASVASVAAAVAQPRPSAFASLAAALTPGSASATAASAVDVAPATSNPSRAKPIAKPVKPAPSAAAVAGVPAVASRPSPAAILADAAPSRPSDSAATGRFVVQVGAFTEDAKVHEARGKVEKTGLKTYTQQVDTPGGKRVRVRVGPFATKAEADKAAARIKASGLPAAVLAL
jgi:DedD protein